MTAFSAGPTTTLAYGLTALTATLPNVGGGAQVEIQNDAAGTVWVSFYKAISGAKPAIIGASPNSSYSYPVLAGMSKLVTVGDADTLSAIGAATGTLYVTQGFGD
jgi:hypothetical protein